MCALSEMYLQSIMNEYTQYSIFSKCVNICNDPYWNDLTVISARTNTHTHTP